MLATITGEPEICPDERDPMNIAIFMNMRVGHQAVEAVYLLNLTEEEMPAFKDGQTIHAEGTSATLEHGQHLTISRYRLTQAA